MGPAALPASSRRAEAATKSSARIARRGSLVGSIYRSGKDQNARSKSKGWPKPPPDYTWRAKRCYLPVAAVLVRLKLVVSHVSVPGGATWITGTVVTTV